MQYLSAFSSYFAFSSSLEQARETSPSNAETDVLLFRNFPQLWYAGLVLPRVENSAEVSDLVLDARVRISMRCSS